jgi:hypothetical protein
MRKSIAILVAFGLALTVVASTWACPPVQEGTEVEVVGSVEGIDLEANLLTVAGTTFAVQDDTLIWVGPGRWGQQVTLGDLEVGMWVEVTGLEQADGTLVAQRIHVESEPGDEDGEEPPSARHPVVDRISTLFGLDYEDVMAMWEEDIGLGLIKKAYLLAARNPQAGLSGADLLQMRLEGLGWGQVLRGEGIHPGTPMPPWGARGALEAPDDEHGRPPWAGQGRGRVSHPGRGHGPPISRGE